MKVERMTTQRFKAIVTKTGSRTSITLPFNPNEIWGVKQRHHITGTINGCAVRGSLGSDGSQYFLPLGAAWRRDNGVEAGAEVEVEHCFRLVQSPAKLSVITFGEDNVAGRPARRFYERMGFQAAEMAPNALREARAKPTAARCFESALCSKSPSP
jgi:hypothetical protein